MIYFISVFLILPFSCFAESVTLTPDVLWYSVNQAQWIGGGNNNIVITAQCSNTTTCAVAQIKMGANILAKPTMSYSDGIYSTTYRPPSVSPFGGIYEVKVKCDDEWINDTKTFSIHKIKVDLDGVSSFQTYEKTVMIDKTTDIDVYTTVFDNEEHIDINHISSDDELSFGVKIYTDDNDVLYDSVVNIDKREPNTRTNYGDWILHLGKMPQSSILDKDYNVKLTINYKDKITSRIETAFFHFNGFDEVEEEEENNNNDEPEEYLYATISDLSDPLYIAGEVSNVDAHIRINQSLSNFDLKKEHFSAELYDDVDKIATLKINSMNKDSSKEYTLNLEDIPSLDIEKDEYHIKLYLEYPGQNEILIDVPVEMAIEFGGVVKKKDGVVVPTTIEIRKTGFYKKIKTDTKGEFNSILPFDTYDIKFMFENGANNPVIVKTNGVTFEKTESSVNFAKNSIVYDNINSGEVDIDLNGMRVANMIVFQFALPYEDIEVQTYYDASKIYNEENIAVFKCTNWNNGAQNCISGFIQVNDITKNTNSDFIIIKTSYLGSFIVSSIDSVSIELNKMNMEYYSEEDMVFEGNVVDMENHALDKATVYYYIKDTNIAGDIETQEDGSFETIFDAPVKSGIYRLYYYASKSPFFPSKNESVTFKILQKPDFDLTLPSSDSRKIILGEKANLDFILKNNGDMTINDILIDVQCDGLNEKEQYNYYPKTLDKLSKNDEEKITFFIELDDDYCELYGCKTVYSCGITIESKEKTITDSLVLPLNLVQGDIKTSDSRSTSANEDKEIETKIEKNNILPKFSITGFASKITSPINKDNITNMKIAAVFLLIIVSVLVLKNKNNPGKAYNYSGGKYKYKNIAARKSVINSFNKIKEEVKGKL
ncbi:MAG: hypothetical protein KAR87_04130 [Candidatus Aenigmarchaeota archaeon]|nr:hypothetical protein [Candidatus Aenigmarchaeota archaeon]